MKLLMIIMMKCENDITLEQKIRKHLEKVRKKLFPNKHIGYDINTQIEKIKLMNDFKILN